MPERLSMRKVREVLRLKHQGRSRAEIAASVGIGETTVGDYVARASAAG
jgi:DNA-binding NarL/FixJ family response regulator